jgi:hypothetical protein
MPQKIFGIEITIWLGILGFFISIVNLYRSIREKKVKLDANIGFIGNTTHVNIYNNSSRRITISYFKIYRAKFRYLAKRHYVRTGYHEGENTHFLIEPYSHVTLNFQEQNSISEKFLTGALFLKVYIPGNIKRIIRLTA